MKALRMSDLPWWENVNTDGKPRMFISRMTAEVKRMFLVEDRSTGVIWDPPVLPDLSRWEFWFTKSMIPDDAPLYKDCVKHNITGVKCELNLPNGFPMEHPTIRIIWPRVAGGFVFTHGAICFEPLTKEGWISAMNISALVEALNAFFNDPSRPVRIADLGEYDGKTKETMRVKDYTREAAEREAKTINQAHAGQRWGQRLENMKS